MASNVDSNQKDVVKWFREAGAIVDHLHFVGHGFPDLCVQYRGLNLLVEVKSGHHRLNDRQQEWHAAHPGLVYVVRNRQDVTEIIEHVDQFMSIIKQYDIPLVKKIKEAE